MNPKNKRSLPLFEAIGLVVFATLMAISLPAQANLNKKKVLRDASGVFRGVVSGGNYVVTYDNGSPGFSFTGPTIDYKSFARIRQGRSSRRFSDEDLPGDEKAKITGTQRPRVTRGGRRVAMRVVGGVFVEDDGPTKGPWTRGAGNGGLNKRGKAWSGKGAGSARQRNSSAEGQPADHTRSVTGRKVSGRG